MPRPTRRATLSALLLHALFIAACGGPPPTPTPSPGLSTADFPRAGGCGDTVIHAATAADDALVVIRWPDAATRARADGLFEQTATLPSSDVLVRLQVGRFLSEGQCTDIIMPGRPTLLGETEARSGIIQLRIEPDTGDPLFPTGRASVLLTDVVFEFGSGENAERVRIERLELDDISVGWLPG